MKEKEKEKEKKKKKKKEINKKRVSEIVKIPEERKIENITL